MSVSTPRTDVVSQGKEKREREIEARRITDLKDHLELFALGERVGDVESGVMGEGHLADG